MKRRIARDRRRAGVRVVLGKRDEAMLRALARFRIARTSDLAELFFSGVRRDTASARLRKLLDAGFIEARSVRLDEENVYQLGPEGRCWAEEGGVVAAKPPAAPATHHLAVVRLWAQLAAALAKDGAPRLRRFEPDWELRSRLVGSGAPVVPDAVIEFADREVHSRSSSRIALEVDLTTERLGALQRKLACYDVSRCFVGDDPVVLVVVLVGAGLRRVSSVQMLVQTCWSGRAHVFPESDWPAALVRQLHERPLASSPSSEGTDEGVTPSESARFLRQGEGSSPSTNNPERPAGGD